jgi:hypothetical protein
VSAHELIVQILQVSCKPVVRARVVALQGRQLIQKIVLEVQQLVFLLVLRACRAAPVVLENIPVILKKREHFVMSAGVIVDQIIRINLVPEHQIHQRCVILPMICQLLQQIAP